MKIPLILMRLGCFNAIRTWLGLAGLGLAAHPSEVLGQLERGVIDPDYRLEVINLISNLVNERYVLAREAEHYAAELLARATAGAYDTCMALESLADRVTGDLREITGDSHFSVRVRDLPGGASVAEGTLFHPMRLNRLQQVEHLGYTRLEWIDGNIGYLDLRRFYPISVARSQIDAAMLFLSTADAIIVDIREHRGGDVESLEYLCSYFLKYPTQLTGFYFREDDFLTEHWTTEEIGGQRLLDVPLFVLTSNTTFSAAEMFAYDLSMSRRATIVGDTTAGGAHSVDLFRVDDQLEIYIPTARAIHPATSSNWEGIGVIPNVVVSSEVALDTALVLAASATEEHAARREARLVLVGERMQQQLDLAEILYREGETHAAQAAVDSAMKLGVAEGLVSEFFLEVLAYEYLSATHSEILISIAKKRIELFPESSAAYAALGYVHYRRGEFGLAIECYERLLELTPNDRNAAKMIQRLNELSDPAPNSTNGSLCQA